MTTIEYDKDNIFAKILRGDAPCFKVYENKNTLSFMDIMPRAKGHVLVLPKKSVRNLFDVDSETFQSVAEVTRKMACAVKEAFHADGVTIQQLNETAGGQIIFHLHVHIIPRFEGVPLKSYPQEKAFPETLDEQAKNISSVFHRLYG